MQLRPSGPLEVPRRILLRRRLLGAAFTSALVIEGALPAVADPSPSPPTRANVAEGYVKAEDGIYLFFRKVGQGPQVVVAPLQFLLYEGLKTLAAPDRTLIFYDVRNRGSSTAVGDDTKISIQHDIADVDVIRRSFGAERVTLIGFSYAGLMVALYAMDHPERVERMVQLGPVPITFPTQYPKDFMPDDGDRVPDPAGLAALGELEKQGMISNDPRGYCEREWAVTRFGLVGEASNADRLGAGPCSLPNEWPLNFNRHLRLHLKSVQDLVVDRKRVASIRQPVLIVHGTKDRNAPYGAGREWSWLLPEGRLLTVRGAAHMSWIDAPDVVLPAIDRFLRGNWPAGVEKVGTPPQPPVP